jgi:chromosomal replication initiator protein
MWLCRTLTPLSLERIGVAFGGRDHGTVICAIRSVGDRSATEPKFASQLLDLRHRCEEALK